MMMRRMIFSPTCFFTKSSDFTIISMARWSALFGTRTEPRYRLDVLLDDDLEGLGLLTDETVGRERRTLRARYQLVDLSSGNIVVDATAGSDAGIDVVSSEFATIAAEQTALERLSQEIADQIVARLALYATRTSEAQ